MLDQWLLCDFHIHTTVSDGSLSIPEVVDLYGEHGFDAISITDHVLEKTHLERARERGGNECLTREEFEDYMRAIWHESRRAWEEYEMLLFPGVEVTNDLDHFHLLALDVKSFICPDGSVPAVVAEIHRQGGIAVACHPFERNHTVGQQSSHLWLNHETYAPLFDAWEVANRDDLFNVVGLKKFNYIANSDFHQPRHLYSWKTLLRCPKNVEAIKSAVRTNTGVAVYLYRETPSAAASSPPPNA